MQNYIVYGILGISIAVNGYQVYRIDTFKQYQNILNQKDSLTQSGYNELLYSHINGIKNENIDMAKNQGKIEGILSVVNNIKPESNDISAIWHSGYYRGMDQVEFVRQTSYEEGYHRACDDMSCPAGNSPSLSPKKLMDKIPTTPTENKPIENKSEKPVDNSNPKK